MKIFRFIFRTSIVSVCLISLIRCGSGGGTSSNAISVRLPSIAAGELSSIAIKKDGTVFTWGGQIGQYAPPVHISGPGGAGFLENVVIVAAGVGHSLALRSDGSVWAWGWNGNGELGDNTTNYSNNPVRVKGSGGVGFLDNIVSIAAGNGHSLALQQNGTVWAWGNNYNGQLGDNTINEHHYPVQVCGLDGVGYLSDVVSIAACYNNSLSVKKDGSLLMWGWNIHGQLGDNTTTDRHVPVQVIGVGGTMILTNIKRAVLGMDHSVALRNDGTVVAWGNNYSGQLGDGTTTNRLLPVQVMGPEGLGYLVGVKVIGAGYSHSLAVKDDGTVLAWGSNISGQLGDATAYNRYVPVHVLGLNGVGELNNIIAIAAGRYHSIAIKSDGSLYGWGNNYNCQLGDNTSINNRYTPISIPIDL